MDKEKKELTPEEKVKQNRFWKIVYASVVGGLALTSMVLFASAQYTKSKLSSADMLVLSSKNVLNAIDGEKALQDETNIYHDKALWYTEQYEHFSELSKKHLSQYTALSITAYSLSIITLVSFGLVLKHSDARKEKEDQ